MASLIEMEGYPLSSEGLHAPQGSGRLVRGPHVQEGDFCDLLPGREAVALISPTGETILLHASEGKTTFHVPAGWTILVSSMELKTRQTVTQVVDAEEGPQTRQVEGLVTRLDTIPRIYHEIAGLKS